MRERRVREGARTRRRRSGRRVRGSKHAIYSVRSRVRTFRNGGVRRRRRHREYRALRYRVVYVGAIAVLLRFVVMRLNRNEWEEPKETPAQAKGIRGRTRRIRRVGTWQTSQNTARSVLRGERGREESSREGRWSEYREMEKHRDERERRTELGQYRYSEGRKQVGRAGRVRRVSRRGAVVLTREDNNREKSKAQRVSSQLARKK